MKAYHSLCMLCALCASLFLFSCKKQIPVTSIALDQTDMVLDKGQTGSLTATLEPAEATANAVSWTSSATDVVTVSANGTTATIKAVKGGTATISVTSGPRPIFPRMASVPNRRMSAITLPGAKRNPIMKKGTPWTIPAVIGEGTKAVMTGRLTSI